MNVEYPISLKSLGIVVISASIPLTVFMLYTGSINTPVELEISKMYSARKVYKYCIFHKRKCKKLKM